LASITKGLDSAGVEQTDQPDFMLEEDVSHWKNFESTGDLSILASVLCRDSVCFAILKGQRLWLHDWVWIETVRDKRNVGPYGTCVEGIVQTMAFWRLIFRGQFVFVRGCSGHTQGRSSRTNPLSWSHTLDTFLVLLFFGNRIGQRRSSPLPDLLDVTG
jgi:hypothetical protein